MRTHILIAIAALTVGTVLGAAASLTVADHLSTSMEGSETELRALALEGADREMPGRPEIVEPEPPTLSDVVLPTEPLEPPALEPKAARAQGLEFPSTPQLESLRVAGRPGGDVHVPPAPRSIHEPESPELAAEPDVTVSLEPPELAPVESGVSSGAGAPSCCLVSSEAPAFDGSGC